jgi:NTE family protein
MSKNISQPEIVEVLSPEVLSPVAHEEEHEPREARALKGIALCLSGGGYRAMVFHLGALWRLNELGYLPKLTRISSVSGGSITSGVLAVAWPHLTFDASGVSSNFNSLVVAQVRKMADQTIDVGSVIRGILTVGSIGDKIAKAYSRYLFGEKTLQDLPDEPRFVINATNVQSGVLWRFSKPFTWDYRVGEIKNPTIKIAVAVAASSAFPPVLSPVVLNLKNSDYTPNSGKDLQYEPFTTKVVLTDGGVYDNLGLETAWKSAETILVSDGGGNLPPQGKPWKDWFMHMLRVLFIIDNQVRSLRKRQTIESYQLGVRKGTYWGIRTNINDYELSDALDCPFDKTTALANISTRLKRLESLEQERLINWGYAVCDAAMRKHVDPNLPKPSGFPYPAAKV